MHSLLKSAYLLALILTLAASGIQAQGLSVREAPDRQLALETRVESHILWDVRVDFERVVVRLSGPDGLELTREFDPGDTVFLDAVDPGAPLPDGSYKYELFAEPRVSESDRYFLQLEREAGRSYSESRLREMGILPEEELRQAGEFRVADGMIVVPDALTVPGNRDGLASTPGPVDAQTINDNLSVVGSACVGFDCPNTPNYGFTTILMMENNLRIKFDDTSNTASFPNNDWSLEANDSSNGGVNRFMLRDCGTANGQGLCTGNTVFGVEAGAPNGAFYIDSSGRIGRRTTTPVVEFHMVDGDTPTVRLQQDGSSGFTPQTWDVAGNETSFFIRDATNSSNLPFRIRPSSGNVSIGNHLANASLHVRRTDGSTHLLVQETSGTTANRNLFSLVNNGAPQFKFENSNNGAIWNFAQSGTGNFQVTAQGTGGPEMLIQLDGRVQMGPGATINFDLTPGGDLFINNGMVFDASHSSLKQAVQPVDSRAILTRVLDLPIASWRYKKGGEDHLGPMAEDFHKLLGLGTERHLAALDTAGVSLAAIQGLYDLMREVQQEQQARIAELETQLLELRAQLAAANER